jgi:molecular chaperone GrpE
MTIIARRAERALLVRVRLPSRQCKGNNPMAHNDSDDKVDLAGEGLSADSQEPAAVEAANENASLRDRLLRALAEVENTRRRAERSVADAREYGISDFAAELLSVVDSLQRAIASAEDRIDQTPADAALLDGVRATQRQLLATLERFGVRRIEALGASFDPNFHEAMVEVDDDSSPLGSVVSVLEDGYMIHDRLLRAARVAVAKRRLEAAPRIDVASGA